MRSVVLLSLVLTMGFAANARIVNTINLTGARKEFDTEAEYRLLQLATTIIEARRADTELSLAMKGAYGASILGDMATHDSKIVDAEKAITNLKQAWSDVALASDSMAQWLTGRIRPEYAAAFKQVAEGHEELRNRLMAEGATRPYMSWAFDEIVGYTKSESSADAAIIKSFRRLKDLAYANIESIESFVDSLESARKEVDFKKNGLYGHIFDFIAIRAEKPDIFTKDEQFFSSIAEFDIYYEALEQITREAHKLVPKTHDLVFENFDLKFTPEDVNLMK